MTLKQEKFIDFYIQTGNASKAARLAGYSEKGAASAGAKNLKQLRKEIDIRQKQLASERLADMYRINEFWSRLISGEEKEEKAVYNPETKEVEVVYIKPPLKDRLRASEMRAKVIGAFEEKASAAQSEEGLRWFV